MPRIPIYSARQSLQTDAGGLPSVRSSNAMANALKQLGQSIGGMERPANDGTLARRSQALQEKRQVFDRIRSTHDTISGLETELVQRRDKLTADGEGFYMAFVGEAVTPALETAVNARPKDQQEGFRAVLLRQAEPLLEAAALIEHEQSRRFYLAETDRIADQLIEGLDLEGYERIKGDLNELLEAAPIPSSDKDWKKPELDRKLARQVFGLMLADNPASLTEGALGWSKRMGKAQTVDARFQSLSTTERREMFERAVSVLKNSG